jgi:hypothetical protein
MVIENLSFVIGERRSESFAKNAQLSGIALQNAQGKGVARRLAD